MKLKNLIWMAAGVMPALLMFAQADKKGAATKAAPAAAVAATEIAGKVSYTGPAVRLGRIDMSAAPACAKGAKGPSVSQEVMLAADKGLGNVLVYVKSGMKAGTAPSTPVVLDQKGCVYLPHVFTVMVGQPVEIRNSDATGHNIHPMPKSNPEWNESQGAGEPAKKKTFARAEIGLPIKCNVHPWMKTYAHVMTHQFHAITAPDGSYSIKGLPAGEYTIGIWHEKFGEQEMKVKVGTRQDFAYKG